MKLCPDREVCEKYSSGTRMPPNNDVRDKYQCIYWKHKKCVLEGNACELGKIKRIKGKLNEWKR